ncbi:MAG: hypothetical protein DMG21_17225 [Acidobacteria bacterium]|nr:MAG: hypothetical protein DMG21_17225 [Acidobacteriota bacterium]
MWPAWALQAGRTFSQGLVLLRLFWLGTIQLNLTRRIVLHAGISWAYNHPRAQIVSTMLLEARPQCFV